jgi:hypothetical protein
VYHGDNPDATRQLVENIWVHEAVVRIRNELGRTQWQHSVAQRLAAFMDLSGGHFERVL